MPAFLLTVLGCQRYRGEGELGRHPSLRRATVPASRDLRCSRRLCPAPSTRRGTAARPSPIANLRWCWGGLRVFQPRDGIFIFRLAACMLWALPTAWHITTCGGRVGHCCTGNNTPTHTVTGHVWLSYGGHAHLSKWRLFQRHPNSKIK